MTRVLHLLGTTTLSGAENVIATIMEQCAGSELEMAYCSPEGPIRVSIESRGLDFVALPRLTPGGVRRVLRDHPVDVIHAHDFIASVVAALSGFRGRIVSHIHSNPRFVKSWNPLTVAYRIASRRFTRVVFVSDEATRGTVFADAVADRTRVIHNVIDRERVRSLAEAEAVPPADVVFLGRLTDVKQPTVVLRAIARARATVPGLRGRLVGEGVLRDACEREIAELGLGESVTLEGFQGNPYPYVRAAKVAMMPSRFEGLPLSALECLALGVPVLNSGAGGLGDLFAAHPEMICATVDEYAARLVEIQDPEAYQQFRDACDEIVAPYIDLDRYRAQIVELYA